jgi:hypothetical protein
LFSKKGANRLTSFRFTVLISVGGGSFWVLATLSCGCVNFFQATVRLLWFCFAMVPPCYFFHVSFTQNK